MVAPVDSGCVEVITQLMGSDASDEDVAQLAVRQDSGEIGPLDLAVPALPRSLRDIRVAMRRWLSTSGPRR